jgi:hypothetical protein
MTLVWKSGWDGLTESEAIDYVAAVEAADGQELEFGVAKAINDFVLGCKQDDIWNAIKASCILAGARTLDGALVPLTGGAPTNFNFVGADYDRETGLKGNGSTKHLDSNRANNADPQDDKHLSVYQTSLATSNSILIGTQNVTGRSALISFVAGGISVRINSNVETSKIGNSVGFVGGVRSSSSTSTGRVNGTNFLQSIASQSPATLDIGVFAEASGIAKTDARLSFYSIGESLDLAKLDTRVSNLMTAIGAAIP